MSKSQNWMLWFNAVEMLNAKGHEVPKDFTFDRGFVAAACARCGQAFRARYYAESGPLDTRGAGDFIRCDNSLAIDAARETQETKEEVAR